MLKSHIDAYEKLLLCSSEIASNSGHPNHKGTPREDFIRHFLKEHLGERVGIGTGEIIDYQSKPNDQRNQYDIIIYNKDYPKIKFGGEIHAFLAESVIATIEVKSKLEQKDMGAIIKSAYNSKNLQRSILKTEHPNDSKPTFAIGYQPPSILNYVVAYDSTVKSMQTIFKWIYEIHKEQGIVCPQLNFNPAYRTKQPSLSIDGVFVLGKGFIYFDNVPIGFSSQANRLHNPNIKWVLSNSESGNLMLLFVFILQAISSISGSWFDMGLYLESYGRPELIFVEEN